MNDNQVVGNCVERVITWYSNRIPDNQLWACIVAIEGISYPAIWDYTIHKFIDPDGRPYKERVEWWAFMPTPPDIKRG